ncbi:hypothetical protein Tco_0992701 [Tanacetum coccineum]|uniref:Uncharacterized protein n=1 Tax=Tanacetum coccineum TaxID=301880 RepID=A0ABQ5F349_9ASTR
MSLIVSRNPPCFNAFTISADVLKSIAASSDKVCGQCESLGLILDICPRVDGVDFTDVPDDDATLAFLIELGYKGPLYKYTNINPNIPKVLPDVHQVFHWSDSPKKSRDKGSQRKKTVDDSQETVDVSEESEPEPKPVKRKTASRRVVKKKVTISIDDNIISDDHDVALELGKSISKTEAEEAEAARQVHATHARIVTESIPKPTKSTIPGVPDESAVVSATSSEGTSTKPGVLDEENDISEENVILEWGSE